VELRVRRVKVANDRNTSDARSLILGCLLGPSVCQAIEVAFPGRPRVPLNLWIEPYEVIIVATPRVPT
jgi:hypothetical protein